MDIVLILLILLLLLGVSGAWVVHKLFWIAVVILLVGLIRYLWNGSSKL